MYVYADETGNEGKNIFGNQRIYILGSIIAKNDLDIHLAQCVTDELQRQKHLDPTITKIHAKNMQPKDVAKFTNTLLDNLKGLEWKFHLTIIDKHYLPAIKFVDTVFDSGENDGARAMYYNVRHLRHALCCWIDGCMSPSIKEKFWNAYLNDNYIELATVAGEILLTIDAMEMDPRLKQVLRDAIISFIKDPQQVFLDAKANRKSYKAHTPNMISFASLIHTINSQSIEWECGIDAFIHDRQGEFKDSMQTYVELFSAMAMTIDDFSIPKVKEIESWKSKFSIKSAQESAGLQACDIFLWNIQRIGSDDSWEIPDELDESIEIFQFSRNSSVEIVNNGFEYFNSLPLSSDDIQRGKEFCRKAEESFRTKAKDRTLPF